MTKRSNRTRGTRKDRMGYGLKAKAISGGTNRTRGSITAQVPVFTVDPLDKVVDEFDSTSLFAEAVSPDVPPSPILGYQWQFKRPGESFWVDATDGPQPNGTVLSGSQTQTIMITNVSGNADGYVARCSAVNQWGVGYSKTATITVSSLEYFIITEAGESVIDEPAANFIVDERTVP